MDGETGRKKEKNRVLVSKSEVINAYNEYFMKIFLNLEKRGQSSPGPMPRK